MHLLALPLCAVAALSSVAPAPPQTAPPVIQRVLTSERRIAFTFDDGPNELYTPQFIALLQRYGAHATFFLIGSEATKHPAMIRQLRAAGMEVANHGMRHRYLRSDDGEAALAEVRAGEQAIVSANVPRPTLYRLPGGIGGPRVRQAVASLGYRLVGWSIDPRDSMNASAAKIVQIVREQAAPGAIVLMHDGPPTAARLPTLAALRTLLPELKAQGYTICSVGELLRSARSFS